MTSSSTSHRRRSTKAQTAPNHPLWVYQYDRYKFPNALFMNYHARDQMIPRTWPEEKVDATVAKTDHPKTHRGFDEHNKHIENRYINDTDFIVINLKEGSIIQLSDCTRPASNPFRPVRLTKKPRKNPKLPNYISKA